MNTQFSSLKKKGVGLTALTINRLRALAYTFESLPLPIMNQIITGQKMPQISREDQIKIIQKTEKLMKLDAQDAADGFYSLSTLAPDFSMNHLFKYLEILADGSMSSLRRRFNKTAEFSEKIDDLSTYPKYYQRNFHHQTDGYLSEKSADLYEHQVEILFRGLANPMRRRLIKPMKNKLFQNKKIKILEIGCGTGVFSRILAEAFPQSQIMAIDLSPHYIKYAKAKSLDFKNIDYMVADAEHIPFRDATFDAVVSVYLHHELPFKNRKSIIAESLRVVTQDGFWGLIDSIQLKDDLDLDWALQQFPINFHEPYYTNYVKKPLLNILSEVSPKEEFTQEVNLLSKVVYRK